jgi:hypothetical protein
LSIHETPSLGKGFNYLMKILLVEREIEIGLGTGAMMAEALTKMAQQAVTT